MGKKQGLEISRRSFLKVGAAATLSRAIPSSVAEALLKLKPVAYQGFAEELSAYAAALHAAAAMETPTQADIISGLEKGESVEAVGQSLLQLLSHAEARFNAVAQIGRNEAGAGILEQLLELYVHSENPAISDKETERLQQNISKILKKLGVDEDTWDNITFNDFPSADGGRFTVNTLLDYEKRALTSEMIDHLLIRGQADPLYKQKLEIAVQLAEYAFPKNGLVQVFQQTRLCDVLGEDNADPFIAQMQKRLVAAMPRDTFEELMLNQWPEGYYKPSPAELERLPAIKARVFDLLPEAQPQLIRQMAADRTALERVMLTDGNDPWIERIARQAMNALTKEMLGEIMRDDNPEHVALKERIATLALEEPVFLSGAAGDGTAQPASWRDRVQQNRLEGGHRPENDITQAK